MYVHPHTRTQLLTHAHTFLTKDMHALIHAHKQIHTHTDTDTDKQKHTLTNRHILVNIQSDMLTQLPPFSP